MEMPEKRLLEGQVALVTGGSSGIGKAIAEAMGAAGANLLVNHLSDEKGARETARAVEAHGGRAVIREADVSDEEAVEAMFRTTLEEFGTLDILVSNAGIQQDADLLDMTLDQWRQVLNVHLTGGFLCAREAAREFCRRGIVPEISRAAGKILFTSSVHEVIPWAGHANYAAAKGGIMLLMKSLAQELGPHRIRVNSLGPGAIRTNINREVWEDPESASALCKLIPYGRIGEPVDVARTAVWLVSDEADYITGTTLYMDGGMLLYPGFRTGG